jgi:hypothetical protein
VAEPQVTSTWVELINEWLKNPHVVKTQDIFVPYLKNKHPNGTFITPQISSKSNN